jgi:hypothetical protein
LNRLYFYSVYRQERVVKGPKAEKFKGKAAGPLNRRAAQPLKYVYSEEPDLTGGHRIR